MNKKETNFVEVVCLVFLSLVTCIALTHPVAFPYLWIVTLVCIAMLSFDLWRNVG